MNLKELSQIDIKNLKNVDWKEVLDFFKARWDISAQFIAVIVSIFVCIWVYNVNKVKFSQLSTQVKAAQEKLAKVNELQEVESFKTKIFDSLPPEISEKRLINLTADLAKEYNVRIHSFSPGEPMKKEKHTIFPLTLNLSSQNYKSMWAFIEQLETLPEAITIQSFALGSNSLSTRSGQSSNRRAGGLPADGSDTANEFSITITLYAVNFLKNE